MSVVRFLNNHRFSAREKYLPLPTTLLGILVLSRIISPDSLPEICIFKLITHIPCMFCGLTHAFHAISTGNFEDVVNFHPLAIIAYGVVIFLTIFSISRLIFWDKLKKYHGIEEKILTSAFILFTIVWLYRIISGDIL